MASALPIPAVTSFKGETYRNTRSFTVKVSPMVVSPKVSDHHSSLFRSIPSNPKEREYVPIQQNFPSSVSLRNNSDPIIVIDNYDSFTYNLCQYVGSLGCKLEVYRNDELTVGELQRKRPRGILISPGPGVPQDSGISLRTVVELGPTVPLFGVCMGLQCIGEAFGGSIVRSPCGVMHGKKSLVYYDEKGEDGLLAGLSNPFCAGRYHSLVIDKNSFPSDELEVTAWTEDGLIMGVRHKKYRHMQAVQFHPESIITKEGMVIVQNFVKLIERYEEKIGERRSSS